jgi:hypothetical protein
MANPRIGQPATLNGKKVVWSGQNYGWQSPATHKKLADQGKFRVGTQALDRLSSSANRALEKHAPGVAKAASAVKAHMNENDRKVAARDSKTAVGRYFINPTKAVTQAPARAKAAVVEEASKRTNVDRRIVGAAATAAQAAIAGKALNKPAPNRSVGAAANPARGSRIQNVTISPSGQVTTPATTKSIKGAYANKPAITGKNAKRLQQHVKPNIRSSTSPTAQQQRANQLEYGNDYNPSSTRFAQGTRRDDTRPAPRSRTTRPTRQEQARTIKSGLRDRGQAHVEANTPRSSRQTADQARGNRYSASRNGQGFDPNYGSRPQPRSTTGNNRIDPRGDSRQAAREAGRARVAAYNAGDPSAQSPARRRGAQQIIRDRVANETRGMNAQERQAFRRRLTTQANRGERRVRAAAEAQYSSEYRRDRYGRSPSTAIQNYSPASRDLRRLSDSARNRMAEDFGRARQRSGPIRPARGDNANNAIPASTDRGLRRATTPSQRDLTRRTPARPQRRQGDQQEPTTSLSIRGRETLRPQGRPIRNAGNTSQRRAENLPAPGPQTRRQSADRARSQRADQSLRTRNTGNTQRRTREDAMRRLRTIQRENREVRRRGRG